MHALRVRSNPCLLRSQRPLDLLLNARARPTIDGPGSGRGGGIRTHGDLRHAGFQDRCIRPLCHPSLDCKACCGREELSLVGGILQE